MNTHYDAFQVVLALALPAPLHRRRQIRVPQPRLLAQVDAHAGRERGPRPVGDHAAVAAAQQEGLEDDGGGDAGEDQRCEGDDGGGDAEEDQRCEGEYADEVEEGRTVQRRRGLDSGLDAAVGGGSGNEVPVEDESLKVLEKTVNDADEAVLLLVADTPLLLGADADGGDVGRRQKKARLAALHLDSHPISFMDLPAVR
ncbi:hypothetical protein C8R44DRAFT_752814 [Mycena epipterygia]|nr:hypothetical protein C8R44DRAFT_752814 [Mycena epipterygia]